MSENYTAEQMEADFRMLENCDHFTTGLEKQALTRLRQAAQMMREVQACSCCGRSDALETKCTDCGEIQTVYTVRDRQISDAMSTGGVAGRSMDRNKRQPVKVTDEDVERAVSMLDEYVDEKAGGSADAMTIADWQCVMRAALESFATRHAAVPDVTKRVAEHMARSVEYIEKVYPNARQLDAGPIMRNLRRWSRMLAAAPEATK